MTNFAKIKAELTEKLLTLNERMEEIDDDLSQPGDDDWEENAIESEDDEVLEKVGSATRDEIRQIKLALTQIEGGTYGTCMTCGKPIAKQRLNALPHVTKCVNCS